METATPKVSRHVEVHIPCAHNPPVTSFADRRTSTVTRIAEQRRAEEERKAMAMINKFVASRHRYTFADVVDRARSQFLDDRARAAGAQHGQFYTDAAMVTRAALRVEPAVIEAIDHAWQCIQAARINTAVAAQAQSPGNPAFRIIPLSDPIRSGDDDHMSRTAYRTMIRKLYLVTHEMSSDVRIDAQEVRTSIDEDWQRDSGGKGKLSRAAFHRCWFELCDLHTRSIEGNEYVRWILRVLRRLLSYAGDAQLVPAPGEPIELHKVAWRSDSSLLDALQRRATIGNADPPGEEDLLRVKAAADLAELLRAKAAVALLSKKAAAHPHWKNAAASDAGAPPAAVFAASTAAPAITMAVAPTPAGLGIVGAGYSPMLARVARAHQFKAGRQSWEAAIAGDQAEAEVALLAEQHSQQLSRLAEGPWGMGDVQLYRGVAERHLLATAPSTRLADNDRSLWHARPTKATMVPAGTVARPYSPASFSQTWRLSATPQELPQEGPLPPQQRQHRRPHVMRKAPPMAHYRCAAVHRQPPMLAGTKSVPVGNGVGNGVHVGAIPYSCRAPDGAGQGQEHELGMKRGSLRAPITAPLRVPGTHHAASQIQLPVWGSPSLQQPQGGEVAPPPPPPQLATAAASLRPASSAGSISIPSATRNASRSENAFARAVSRSHSQPGIFRAGGGWRPAPKGLLVVHVG